MLQELVKFFINPVLQFFLLILIFIIKKRPNRIFIGFVLYFYIVSIPITGILFHYVWKLEDSYNANKRYDCVIVLTGGVSHQWYLQESVSETLPFNFENYFMFNHAAERFFKGIDLVNSGQVKQLFYGNYVPKSKLGSFDTSELVKRFAMQNGLSENQFIIYGNSVKNTLDEASQFKEHIKNKSLENILLITSESHMRRARGLFNNQSIFFDTYSVQKRELFNKNMFMIKNYVPSIRGLRLTKSSFYEFFGFFGYLFTGKL